MQAAEKAQLAAEQARLEAEVQRQAEEKELRNAMEAANAAKDVRPFSVSGTAASGQVFAVATGTLAVDAATTLAIRTALRSAAAAAITASAAAVGTATGVLIVVGVAALVYQALKDKEPYAFSFPLSDLTTFDDNELFAIGHANGEVDLAIAMGSRTAESTTQFVVAAANGTTVPGKVPVRLATYDPDLKVYSVSHPDAPDAAMTWTPIVQPGDSSTALPVKEPNVSPFDGKSLTPLDGRIDISPNLDLYSFGGFITIFPADSGLPPLYLMFNDAYDGANSTGQYSGRRFNKDQAGGEIIKLSWIGEVITQHGIDSVKLHIARLDQSDANDVMIQRLEKILSGQIEPTDTDLRYYTHETRELERFRAQGLSDTFTPETDSPIWNNAHTATLEDYQLRDEESLLYTQDAILAADRQEELFFKNLLKEMGQ